MLTYATDSGMRRLRDAAEMSGSDAASVSRQIHTLSRNRLRREALRAMKSVGPRLRGDPLVREAIGGFFWARGCPAHAADGYGRRAGLSSSSKLLRRLAWIASGGPFAAIRRRMRSWEEAQPIRELPRVRSYLRRLDRVAGLDDQLRVQLRARIENVSYVFNLRVATYHALGRPMMRLSPAAVLPVWLTLFLIVSSAHVVNSASAQPVLS